MNDGIIPKPRVEEFGGEMIPLADKGKPVSIGVSNLDRKQSEAITEASRLLSRRLDLLGSVRAELTKVGGRHQITVKKCSDEEFARLLRVNEVSEAAEEKRLHQSYYLRCARNQNTVVSIEACNDLGLYYGLVSLCQLVERDERGGVCIPAVEIVDWPEIGVRLAKSSASNNPLSALTNLVEWLPLFKINLMGLQFHGENSKELGCFEENVESICSEARQKGILETVVYFCPFRGNAYDFRKQEDRQAYVRLIHWMFEHGAHGIEVDYNDWPGEGTPIEDVINLACKAVEEKSPRAYVLYCPPASGDSSYRGEATAEMRRILSKVPSNVWPLWTGMCTLIEGPLKAEQVERWTRDTGRRPFLWVNRASLGVDQAFSQPVEEMPDCHAFHGKLLPKDIGRLFEGIHLNDVFCKDKDAAGSHKISKPVNAQELACFATMADYIWNPNNWEPVESCRRAKHFVEIMQPLVVE